MNIVIMMARFSDVLILVFINAEGEDMNGKEDGK